MEFCKRSSAKRNLVGLEVVVVGQITKNKTGDCTDDSAPDSACKAVEIRVDAGRQRVVFDHFKAESDNDCACQRHIEACPQGKIRSGFLFNFLRCHCYLLASYAGSLTYLNRGF